MPCIDRTDSRASASECVGRDAVLCGSDTSPASPRATDGVRANGALRTVWHASCSPNCMNREPTIVDTLDRAVEAGQSLLLTRLELVLAEFRGFVHDGGFMLLGGVLAITGWIYVMRGLTNGLSEHYPRYAVELGLGLAHVGLAAFLLLRGRGRAR